MASHNDLDDRGHISAFPDQLAIAAFLRDLGPTQVEMAEQAGIKYNALTNWFTSEPSEMSAVNLLRLVIALGAEQRLAEWLRSCRDSPVLLTQAERDALEALEPAASAVREARPKQRAAGRRRGR